MRRLRAWLGKRRKPQPPVSVEISWNCAPGGEEQFVAWLKKAIRGDGGNAGVPR